MATGTQERPAATPPPPPPPPGQAGRGDLHERFIHEQLDKTRLQVKVVDLASGLMGLAAAVLAFLFVLVLVDHWVFSLGFWGRLLGLLLLLAGVAYFVAIRVAPLVMRRINPVYAAHAIEEAEPSLKNSLINFLLLRPRREAVRQAVFAAVERQAATRLSQVRVETAVDRSRVIRVGYVLATVVALCAIYTFISQKDPLQTVRRIVAPWAQIERPSRVLISDVRPGDERVYQGRTLTISAQVRGLSSDEMVNVYFSTADGQVLDQAVGMTASEDGSGFSCLLPPEAPIDGGIQQDLVYRIEAGDAVTQDYRVEVVPAPSIVVREIRYEFPKYTDRESATQRVSGDVRAIEGTRVTITAQANLEIKSGYVEFDPERTHGDSDQDRTPEQTTDRKVIPLTAKGKEAEVSFTLRLQPDRRTPEHTSYQLRFTTLSGDRNDQPVRHRIQVLPDLPPEVEMLKPARREVDVPEDGQLPIEVRANDADYGLARITLRCVSGGVDVLATDLMDDREGTVGQVIERYEFRPAALRLTTGETAVVWAVAEDNRCDPLTGQPAPNVARTPNYRIRITPPENVPNDPNEDPPEPDAQNDDQGGQSQQEDSAGGDQGESDPQGDQNSGEGEGADSPKSDSGQSEGSENSEGEDGQEGTGQSNTGQSDETESPEGQTGEGEASDAQTGQEGGESGSEQSGGAAGSEQSGAEGGEATEGGHSEGQNPADGQSGNSRPSDGSGGQQITDDRPLDHTGGEDGDVIERLNEHLEEQKGEATDGQGTGQPSNAESGQPDGAQRQDQGAGSDDPGGSSSQPDGGQSSGDPSQPSGQPNPGQQQPGQTPADQPQGPPESGAGPDDQQPPAGSEDAGSEQPNPEQRQPTPGDQQGEATGSESESNDTTGGEPRGGDVPQRQESPEDQPSDERQPGQGDNDQSGGGNRPQDDQGAPESQGGREQRSGDQPPQESQESENNTPEPSSPATDKKPSRSEGGEGGDRKGGGDRGGGQGSQQPGQDSAGSSTGADEGAGADTEPGDGELADKPGAGRQSERPTGQPGGETGPGSQTRPDQSGSSPSESTPSDPAGEGSEPGDAGEGATGQDPQSSPGRQSDGSENSRGTATGGGGPQGNSGEGDAPEGNGVPGDAANLDYAKQATDLALEHLEHLSEEELRETLGWSPDQKRQFLERWQQMYRRAEQSPNPTTHGELDQSLRSLGLRPRSDRLERGTNQVDQLDGLQDASQSRPPAEYRELFDAFKRGTARTGASEPSD